MILLVVAWFCEWGSSVKISFWAAQRKVWPCALASSGVATMVAKSSQLRNVVVTQILLFMVDVDPWVHIFIWKCDLQ